MDLFRNLSSSITLHKERNAFCIDEIFYTYQQFGSCVSAIREKIRPLGNKNIGLILNDDLETYASIIALWLEGKYYIPLHTDTPAERNNNIILQAEIDHIFTSCKVKDLNVKEFIQTSGLRSERNNLEPLPAADSDFAYLLFTSGTTGQPKGVPLTRANLAAFVEAFEAMGLHLDEKDRVLQMFELTFDLSVFSFVIPLIKGSCMYTIPKGRIKFSYIFELMDEHQLTAALMVPSIIHYLRPYFSEINCPKMRYNLFCGEALPLDVLHEWSKCIPEARIFNVYGPTENTIFCTAYEFTRTGENKSHNGVLSIGSAMKGVTTIVVDEKKNILKPGEKGELCLGGELLTPGYWKNKEKNAEAFFELEIKQKPERFYKTGDICFADEDGDLMYVGRLDSQTKIQGYRVELSEVEHHVKDYLGKINAVAVTIKNKLDNTEIALFIESEKVEIDGLLLHMKSKVPPYMIPTQIKTIHTFPLNSNGKIDRNALAKLLMK